MSSCKWFSSLTGNWYERQKSTRMWPRPHFVKAPGPSFKRSSHRGRYLSNTAQQMTPETMHQHSPSRARTALFLLALVVPYSVFFVSVADAAANTEKKCLYVSSYDQGDAWSDEIEASIRSTLEGQCELQSVDMDTQPNQSPELIFASTNRIISKLDCRGIRLPVQKRHWHGGSSSA